MLAKFKRFFGPISKNPRLIVHGILVQLGYSGYIIFNIFFLKSVVGILEKNTMSDLAPMIRVYIVINIVYFVFLIMARHRGWGESFWQHFTNIHREYGKKFNELDNTYVENIGTGKCISIISKGMQTWTDLVLDGIQKPTKLLLSLGASVILLLQIGWYAIALYVGLFVGVHIAVIYLNNFALEWRNKRIDIANEYDRQLVKMIMSKFEILQNEKIEQEVRILDRYANEAQGYVYKLNNYLVAMFTLPNLVFFIVSLVIFSSLLQESISYAVVISVFLILSVVKDNMSESIEFFKNFTKQFYTVEKMWKLFDDAPKITGLHTGKPFVFGTGTVSISNVSFSYGENHVFTDFSSRFEGGKKTAFVGLSGSGKTTLVKLISGFLSPNSGSIQIDGQDLREVSLSSYYRHIGYLTQEPSVFDGSIMENLLYGVHEDHIDATKLQEAIFLAKCDFIADLPSGLDTQIGERGVRLSGGQKQRLAIAKLFIKNPEIIILDEPTSALDSFSEEAIRDAFEKLFDGKTVFIIAHRLQTVKHADDIVVFEHGTIVERGTHESLMQAGGYYQKMLELQSGF